MVREEANPLARSPQSSSVRGGGGGGGKRPRRTSTSKRGAKRGAAAGREGASHEVSVEAERKEQNRLAQREFRQRKQQYIRALEARVELLSSDHDEQVDRLRYALRGLLAENNQLRTIVASFAGFVGIQQIGGPLQKAGLSRGELEEMILGSAEKGARCDMLLVSALYTYAA